MADVVISYARENEASARQLGDAVERLGYSLWRDDSAAQDAASADAAAEQIGIARAVIVIWSEASAGSDWVKAEANVARGLKKLVQVSADGRPPPIPFDRAQMTSILTWRGDEDHPGWQSVQASLATLCGPPSAAAAAATIPVAAIPPEPAPEPVAPPPPAPEPVVAPPPPAPEPVAPAPPPPAPEPVVAPAPPPPPPPPPPAPAPVGAGLATPSRGGPSGLVIGLILLLLLAVIAAGGYYYFYLRPQAAAPAPAPVANAPAPPPAAPAFPSGFTPPPGAEPATPPSAEPGAPPPETLPPAADAQFTRRAVVQDGAGYAVVRSAPTELGFAVDRVNAGESLDVGAQSGAWWRVRTASGRTGYVAASSLRLGASPPPPPPARVAVPPGPGPVATQPPRAPRPARPAEQRPRSRIVRENSKVMSAYCADAGRGTPQCRAYRRAGGD